MTNNTTPRMPHLKQILLWIAIWAAIFIVFRIIGWGVGEACDGTIISSGMALAARAQQEALLQLVSFASLSASFTAPALWPPLEPGFFSILLFAYVF